MRALQDFIKMDCVFGNDYGRGALDFTQFSASMDKAKQPFLFSLSPGSSVAMAADAQNFAATRAAAGGTTQLPTMARMTGDFWDSWGSALGHFTTAANATTYVSKDFYPDLDTLPLGYIAPISQPQRYSKFNLAESRSLVTLMVMAHAPLIWGGTASEDKANATTLGLIANAAVLNVSRNSCGNVQLSRTVVDPPDGWTADPAVASTVSGGGYTRLAEHKSCSNSTVITTKADCSAAFMSLSATLPKGAHDNTRCCNGDNLPFGCSYRTDNDLVYNNQKSSPLSYEKYGGRAICHCQLGSTGCSPPGPPPPPPPSPPPPPPAELIVWAAQARAANSRYVALINVGGMTGTATLSLSDDAMPGGPLTSGKYVSTDLWTGTSSPVEGDKVSAHLEPHASVLMLIELDSSSMKRSVVKTDDGPAQVAVDASKLSTLDGMWKKSVGTGHAALWSRADWRAHLTQVRKDCGFEMVRGHGILDNQVMFYDGADANTNGRSENKSSCKPSLPTARILNFPSSAAAVVLTAAVLRQCSPRSRCCMHVRGRLDSLVYCRRRLRRLQCV